METMWRVQSDLRNWFTNYRGEYANDDWIVRTSTTRRVMNTSRFIYDRMAAIGCVLRCLRNKVNLLVIDLLEVTSAAWHKHKQPMLM